MSGLEASRAGRGGSGLRWKTSVMRATFEAYVEDGGSSGIGELGTAGSGRALLKMDLAFDG
jgi:hypothetical protein